MLTKQFDWTRGVPWEQHREHFYVSPCLQLYTITGLITYSLLLLSLLTLSWFVCFAVFALVSHRGTPDWQPRLDEDCGEVKPVSTSDWSFFNVESKKKHNKAEVCRDCCRWLLDHMGSDWKWMGNAVFLPYFLITDNSRSGPFAELFLLAKAKKLIEFVELLYESNTTLTIFLIFVMIFSTTALPLEWCGLISTYVPDQPLDT